MMRFALILVTLHGVNGQEILVNREEVSSVREPQESGLKYLPAGTKCVLEMTSASPIYLEEDCHTVAEKLGMEK